MRVLIAGAAGFIGAHLAARLLRDGHEVVGVDDFITGRRGNLARLHRDSRFTLLEHDVTEALDVAGPLDWVMHLASPASPPKYLASPQETLRANSEGTRNLLELACVHGAAFFLASTSEVYGDPLVHPQPESYWGHVNPVGPRSVYDEGKRFAEAMTMSYQRSRGLSVRVARIFNTYGPGMDPDDGRVITNFIRQALRGEPLTIHGQGDQTRSFQFIDDLIEAIMRLLESDHQGPLNLGNPEEITVTELAVRINALTGSRAGIEYRPLPVDDPRQRRPDISLARRLLGWSPQIPLDEGLRRTIRAFHAADRGAPAGGAMRA